MYPVFHAKQSLEAHVVAQMLEGHGITTNITGETFLGSGAYHGEIAPNISVCVMSVPDIEKAQKIINTWEEKNPVNNTYKPPPKNLYKEDRTIKNILIFIWGFIVGTLCSSLYTDDLSTILNTFS